LGSNDGLMVSNTWAGTREQPFYAASRLSMSCFHFSVASCALVGEGYWGENPANEALPEITLETYRVYMASCFRRCEIVRNSDDRPPLLL